jgi:glyoxylase-like metal-dependent hydrolase (beta-lactamase superfamily II)
VNNLLEDGDVVGPVRVLHTPGHTPGHLAFWWEERRTLFAGDALATYPVFEAGWPAFNLNPTRQQASVRRMAGMEPEVLAVGHGDPITAGAAVRLRSLVEDL